MIDAIAAGKKAARSINQYLNGQAFEAAGQEKEPEKLTEEEIRALKNRFPSEKRIQVREAPVEKRIKGFEEVFLGFNKDEATKEAMRCLAGQIEGCIQCRECERKCDARAVNYAMQDEVMEVEVGSIILSTGYQEFDPSVIAQYGYKKFDNVITGLEFERLSNATGPTGGEIRLKNGEKPQRVAILHCVGSRDKNYHEYCSRVCCMFGSRWPI